MALISQSVGTYKEKLQSVYRRSDRHRCIQTEKYYEGDVAVGPRENEFVKTSQSSSYIVERHDVNLSKKYR